MKSPARVVSVEHLGGFRLRVTFTDELVRELDFEGVLTDGVFAELEDEHAFAEVTVERGSWNDPLAQWHRHRPGRAPR